ncbi:MAG TPA: glycosyltransferase [Candidatus Sumerlaeota bacterium]|nr:glycosyltransferase [Candidatus Sumerlaeota bacterium]HPS01578.1 glycosyltransferase [Candidatus Sumerlaeota bacterium]
MPAQTSDKPSQPVTPRVLLCGVGPLPLGNPDRLYAPGLRLWGFARALLRGGLGVDILEVQFGKSAESGAGARLYRLRLADDSPEKGDRQPEPDCQGMMLPPHLKADTEDLPAAPLPQMVSRQIQRHPYRAVISTTDILNDACARASGTLPLWCDFNGHPLAERQSQARCFGSDEGLASQWDYVLPPLLRADRFSTCSEAQRLALTGELGACGRLNRWNDGGSFVNALPPAALLTEFTPQPGTLRGTHVPQDAFIVLWTGGYNTWADEETLFHALESALARVPRMVFVSTGGAIGGHDEQTFQRFQQRVQASPFRDRYVFAGWVNTLEVPGYYLEADVGVNCDRQNLEGELGCRNRILDWVAARLPVLTTSVCELARDLIQRDLVGGFSPGNAPELADRLVHLAGCPQDVLCERAERARAYLLEAYAPERAYAPLVEWARNPQHAPDLQNTMARRSETGFSIPDNPLSRRRFQEWRTALEKEKGAGISKLKRKLKEFLNLR